MKVLLAVAASLVVAASGAAAKVELIKNGSFESSSYTANTEFGGSISGKGYTVSQGVTDWTGGSGYDLQYYFFGATKNTVSAIDHYGDKKAYFYSSFSALSPDGGNFVALDGDSKAHGLISQSVSGLTPGKRYTLSFDWAATQLANRQGATTEQLKVGFGGQSYLTSVISNPSKGFTGWFTDTFTFTPTATTQVLSFLSVGTPSGLPPMAVLDGVSLTVVPEPATWALLVVGFGLVGVAARRRSRAVVA